MFLDEVKADRRPEAERAERDLPPIGAPKQVATPTAHAHTSRSWLWEPFWVKGQGWMQRWMRKPRGGKEGEGKRETGRSLLIHIPDITVTLLIQWDKHRRGVRGRTKTKTREKRGGAGVSWMAETEHSHGVPTFSLVLKFFQQISGTQKWLHLKFYN